jgi:hypothetical protein
MKRLQQTGRASRSTAKFEVRCGENFASAGGLGRGPAISRWNGCPRSKASNPVSSSIRSERAGPGSLGDRVHGEPAESLLGEHLERRPKDTLPSPRPGRLGPAADLGASAKFPARPAFGDQGALTRPHRDGIVSLTSRRQRIDRRRRSRMSRITAGPIRGRDGQVSAPDGPGR